MSRENGNIAEIERNNNDTEHFLFTKKSFLRLQKVGKIMLGFKNIILYTNKSKINDYIKSNFRKNIVEVGGFVIDSFDTTNPKTNFHFIDLSLFGSKRVENLSITEFLAKLESEKSGLLYELVAFTNSVGTFQGAKDFIINHANYEKLKDDDVKVPVDFELKKNKVKKETYQKMKNAGVPIPFIINFFAAFDIFIQAGIPYSPPYDVSKKIKCRLTSAAMENLLCSYDTKKSIEFTGEYIKYIQPSYRSRRSFELLYPYFKNKLESIPVGFFLGIDDETEIPPGTKLDIVIDPKYFYTGIIIKDDGTFEALDRSLTKFADYENRYLGINVDTFNELKDGINCPFYSCFFDYEKDMEKLMQNINSCKCLDKNNLFYSVICAFNLKPTALDPSYFESYEIPGIKQNCFNFEMIISLLRCNGGGKNIYLLTDKEKFKEYLENNEGGFDFFRDSIARIEKADKIILDSMFSAIKDNAHECAIEMLAEEKYFKAETAKEYVLFLESVLQSIKETKN